MKFRTEIILQPAEYTVAHSHSILMMGSCFVENISVRMIQGGFKPDVNPFGIIYNPASLANCLQDLICVKTYTETDLFLHQGIFHSFSHHSRFSGSDRLSVLEKINTTIARSSEFLRQAHFLLLTFGTANIYRLASTGQPVSNCHKLPAKIFEEKRLTIEEIVGLWNPLIRDLNRLNPDLKILFTVSPIRHRKNGFHANQLNKAVLLLAVDELVQTHSCCRYFPAYEIMLDDLRDYRFYAEDLTHPNSQAIDYLWEKFGDAFFNKKTMDLIQAHEKQRRAHNHQTIIPA